MQPTRFDRLQRQLGDGLFGGLRGPWRNRSLALLSLLIGIYLGSNLTAYFKIQLPGGRPMLALLLVVGLEVIVRIRTRLLSDRPGLPWLMADNLRLGGVFSVVLEAFKVGS
jgi:uncharacterized membrane protein (UPF0136 family)